MLEDSVTETVWRARQEKRMGSRDGQISPSDWQETRGPLLRHVVVLLAMRHGRAPQAVSSALYTGLLRKGLLSNLDELGNIARRISFLADEQLLMAELRARAVPTTTMPEPLSNESEIAAQGCPHSKDAHKCQ
jgi:DNA-binding NtrC family response regulator